MACMTPLGPPRGANKTPPTMTLMTKCIRSLPLQPLRLGGGGQRAGAVRDAAHHDEQREHNAECRAAEAEELCGREGVTLPPAESIPCLTEVGLIPSLTEVGGDNKQHMSARLGIEARKVTPTAALLKAKSRTPPLISSPLTTKRTVMHWGGLRVGGVSGGLG